MCEFSVEKGHQLTIDNTSFISNKQVTKLVKRSEINKIIHNPYIISLIFVEAFHISPFYVYKIPKMESGNTKVVCSVNIGITAKREEGPLTLWKKKAFQA